MNFGVKNRVNIQQEKEIVDKYLSGKTQIQLRNEYKIGQKLIRRILIRNDVTIREKGSGPRTNKIDFNIDYFKTIDSPDKAYFLGLICADGSIVRQSDKHLYFGRLSIELKDKEILESFVGKLNSNHKVVERNRFDKRTSKTYTGHSLNINSKYFVEHLINLGVTNQKSEQLEFPDIEEKYYSHFLRGLFDGDGCIRKVAKTNRYEVQIISTPEVLETIKSKIFSKLEINSFSERVVCYKNGFNVIKWILFKQDSCKKILNYLYQDSTPDTRLERKFEKYKDFISLNQ